MILITGSTGFLGKNLLNTLKNKQIDYLEMNSSFEGILNESNFKAFDNHKISTVVHLASKTSVLESWNNPEQYLNINSNGTKNVLNFCKSKKAKLIFLSAFVYGNSSTQVKLSENDLPRPSNPYAQSKIIAEEYCEFYKLAYGVEVVILRPFNIYGPFQMRSFLVPELFNKILNTDKFELKNSHFTRDFVYIEDVVDCIFQLILKNWNEFNSSHTKFNVCTGLQTKIIEVANLIKKITDRVDVEIIELPENKTGQEVICSYGDNYLAQKVLGWSPKFNLTTGLELTYSYLKNNRSS